MGRIYRQGTQRVRVIVIVPGDLWLGHPVELVINLEGGCSSGNVNADGAWRAEAYVAVTRHRGRCWWCSHVDIHKSGSSCGTAVAIGIVHPYSLCSRYVPCYRNIIIAGSSTGSYRSTRRDCPLVVCHTCVGSVCISRRAQAY